MYVNKSAGQCKIKQEIYKMIDDDAKLSGSKNISFEKYLL